jgi:creatinine amidohydrolase/Fe(II)-dependent formamide hydrolase-like protein
MLSRAKSSPSLTLHFPRNILADSGFRRILLVNGHGGNSPAQGLIGEWMENFPWTRLTWVAMPAEQEPEDEIRIVERTTA